MTFLVTTDLRRLRGGLPKSSTRIELLENSFQLLKTYTGTESAWLPAFNYDFMSTGSGRYQPDSITTGALNSFIWREKSEWKSQDPVFSLVGWGKKPSTFRLENSNLTPYGKGSIFEELIHSDTKILSFGLGISDGATFMHMVESNRPQGPMYRYNKDFCGVYDLGGETMNLSISMHCRPAGCELKYDLPRLNTDLIANKIVKVLNPQLSIYVGKISNIYDFWVEKATSDPYYLLTPTTKKLFLKIREGLGRDFALTDFE